MAIHSKNEDVILQFGLKKPAFRICVNTPTTHGSVGLTTGLDPAMTLGCGGWGGNITSDNIGPRHLLNIKRLAYEVRPAVTSHLAAAERRRMAPTTNLPKAPARPVVDGIPADALAARIDAFLSARGYKAPEGDGPVGRALSGSPGGPDKVRPTGDAPPTGEEIPADFVCEEDVRAAIRAGRKVLIGEKTILTPSARDLGETQKVFVQAGWPR
jgi:acetaldehyde dehydrogenase (acetylating)